MVSPMKQHSLVPLANQSEGPVGTAVRRGLFVVVDFLYIASGHPTVTFPYNSLGRFAMMPHRSAFSSIIDHSRHFLSLELEAIG